MQESTRAGMHGTVASTLHARRTVTYGASVVANSIRKNGQGCCFAKEATHPAPSSLEVAPMSASPSCPSSSLLPLLLLSSTSSLSSSRITIASSAYCVVRLHGGEARGFSVCSCWAGTCVHATTCTRTLLSLPCKRPPHLRVSIHQYHRVLFGQDGTHVGSTGGLACGGPVRRAGVEMQRSGGIGGVRSKAVSALSAC